MYENIGDEPIECDCCLKWYHRQCLDKTINKKDWESLTGENQFITFKCLDCLQERGDRVSELREIRAFIEVKIQGKQ